MILNHYERVKRSKREYVHFFFLNVHVVRVSNQSRRSIDLSFSQSISCVSVVSSRPLHYIKHKMLWEEKNRSNTPTYNLNRIFFQAGEKEQFSLFYTQLKDRLAPNIGLEPIFVAAQPEYSQVCFCFFPLSSSSSLFLTCLLALCYFFVLTSQNV